MSVIDGQIGPGDVMIVQQFIDRIWRGDNWQWLGLGKMAFVVCGVLYRGYAVRSGNHLKLAYRADGLAMDQDGIWPAMGERIMFVDCDRESA